MKAPTISPDATVGQIVATQPILARIFEHAGIDYCCGGKRTLTEACRKAGLDPSTFAILLDAAARFSSPPTIDLQSMSLKALADHIEATHHAYLRRELPALIEKAERVARKHGVRDARLNVVATTLLGFAEEMTSHMAVEEAVVFPLVRELEKANGPVRSGSIANLIQQMEREHDSAGSAVARLRLLTDEFTPDADACNTHRALLAGLAQLETNLHEHVHKENNVLFPRALAIEAGAAA